MGRLPLLAVLAAAVTIGLRSPLPAAAQDAAPPVAALPAGALPAGAPAIVLARLSTDPHTPEGYSADVDLRVKLRTFPFLGVAVHGTTSFRRPGFYHYHLDNLPRVAAKFDDLNYDLGDPTSWPQRFDIAMAPQSTGDAPVLRLTPKRPGLVYALDIATDVKRARILQATWYRKDGGRIVLTQTYGAVGTADVVTEQQASIDIPHMRAEVSAAYSGVALLAPTLAAVP
jgi:hypothetical protein